VTLVTGAIAALVEHYGGVPFTDESLDLGWNYPGADPKPVYRTMFSEMVHATTGLIFECTNVIC
jgi:hypothetical protein